MRPFGYARRSRGEKGSLRAYVGKLRGLSRAQSRGWPPRHLAGERLQDRRGAPAQPLVRRYTCVFHAKLDTDSTASWTVIPRQAGHRFQGNLDT